MDEVKRFHGYVTRDDTNSRVGAHAALGHPDNLIAKSDDVNAATIYYKWHLHSVDLYSQGKVLRIEGPLVRTTVEPRPNGPEVLFPISLNARFSVSISTRA